MTGIPGPRPVAFDPRPLVDPVDRNAVRAHSQSLKASGAVSSSTASVIVGVIAVVIVCGVLLTFFSAFIGIAFTVIGSSASGSGGFAAVLAALAPIIVIAIIVGVAVPLAIRGMRGASERRFRLHGFARANGMQYIPRLNAPGLPGMLFGTGSDRHSLDVVRGDQPRFVEFGNYRYTTGSGKNRTTHRWGYIAVKLGVPLPHIVLDALGNNGLFGSNLPMNVDRDQRLSLEGDFDSYFSLFCPAGYERDALYLFTPDIMARFIDDAAALDVEIVDDWLFLYSKRDFSTLDPASWAWLFSVVGALLDKLAQWERWRDDRLVDERMPQPGVPFAAPAGVLRPPPGVAAPGRRLRRGIPWAAIVIGGIVLLFWLAPNLFGFVFAFFGR
ncbi:hypothetical protein QL996_04190 [Planococcus sp. APC 4015]|nr:hypothetical protein [Planococcus sp. APC 4015]